MMKKVTTAVLFATLASTPALAWAPIPIQICNHTDPTLVSKVWLSLNPVYTVNVPGGQYRIFGPVAADPSPRTVFVEIITQQGQVEWFQSAKPMDLHAGETWINVYGEPPGFGGAGIVVTHGRGRCA